MSVKYKTASVDNVRAHRALLTIGYPQTGLLHRDAHRSVVVFLTIRMLSKTLPAMLGLVFVMSASTTVAAQLPTGPLPSPGQAQQMLQNNPALIQRLQQMIAGSGLTPD